MAHEFEQNMINEFDVPYNFQASDLYVKEVDCTGWVVPPPIIDFLNELREKHNALVAVLRD